MLPDRVFNVRYDDFDVYVGRPGYGRTSIFGNPYVVGKRCGRCGETHATGGDTLDCYTHYFANRVCTDAEFAARVRSLRGLRLGCWCAPRGGLALWSPLQCHAQIIGRFLATEPAR